LKIGAVKLIKNRTRNIKMKKVCLSVGVSALLALVTFSGCWTDETNGISSANTTETKVTKLAFSEVTAPIKDSDKMSIRTSSSVTYSDGKIDNIGYTTLISAGTVNNAEIFGAAKDYRGKPIVSNVDSSPYICNGTNGGLLGSGVDHSSILQQNGKLFMVSQFECEVGSMYGMELEQNKTTGALSVKPNTMKYISQADGFGGWVHCAGVTTPWESHLGSEEYEPNARFVETNLNPKTMLTSDKYYDEVTKLYWKDENNANASLNNNPYYYGYIPEVKVDASGSTPTYNYTKHFSMGRGAWELAYVMPDEKTAYLSDDGTNVGFYMYVADKAKDLSAGSLYAAKWIQTSAVGVGAGTANIQWIKLGHASDTEIKTIVTSQPKFSDIFDTDSVQSGDTCNSGFTFVNTATGKECLRVKIGKEKQAAFLETRRYASYLGATTEFRKEEGITFNPNARKLYVSMSEVAKGMADTIGDIKVAKNKCGAVYGLKVSDSTETIYDSTNKVIDSKYVVLNTAAEIVGVPETYPKDSPYAAYTCSVNGIASPDNVTYLKDKDTLIIGEDTSAHPNDFLWSYDTVSKKLTRIASTPYGSETTSPYWYKDINGFGYLTLVTQHPFGETEPTDADYALASSASDAQKNSTVGVVGPFKYTK
jgi:uncharacterized protein